MSRETVRSATSMPSFRDWPWMRGAPQRGFAVAMRVIKALISAWTAGRPPVRRGELSPVFAEAAPLPPQDGVGGHDHEGRPPPGRDSGQPDPKEAIRRAQLGSGRI